MVNRLKHLLFHMFNFKNIETLLRAIKSKNLDRPRIAHVPKGKERKIFFKNKEN